MSYEAWHLKYRPKTINDLIGQPFIKRSLSNSITRNEIPNAYLFSGIKGTGKTTTARILAASLNCTKEDKPTVEPCGECTNCKSVWSSSSIDVVEVDCGSQGSVENIRDLIQAAHLSGFGVRYRVYILDESHLLSKQAASSLLLTLEQPPKNVVFILATTDKHKLLETIVSRCIEQKFSAITVNDVVERLKYVAKQEKLEIDDSALKLVARHATGSMRSALTILESLKGETVSIELVRQALQLPNQDYLEELVGFILVGKYEQVLIKAQQLMSESSVEAIINELEKIFRDIYFALNDIKATEKAFRSDAKLDVIEKLKANSTLDELENILCVIRERRKYIEKDNDLDVLLLDLARFGEL